ncbi:cysteine desulfurase family protein [Crassaminicella profunda]|uniref:cysteine desulfurase family protein n=1 Tax=Crassaminicella profunda TaxID=1286698 RepID=UPI001CA7A317|nr:cysteine desulfurase family protein [Crassaminicella profunda]QZY56359.1 cysteine desulfurase [Crassaminicella profunda]
MEVYLDNSATTKPNKEVVEMMLKGLTDYYGNPSSLHHKGVEVEKLMKTARKQLAKALGAREQEIIFTSGGTESNNTAIIGAVESKKRKGKKIITTKIEHPSVLNVYKNLEKKGYEVIYLDVDSFGKINIEELKNYLSEDTILISIMHVNNEVGTVQPVEEIGKIIKNCTNKPILHVDAIQSFGKIKFTPSKLGADLLSISGHKVHGPKGIGGLYIKKNLKVTPIIYGGNQETGIRSGTENVPGILGLGEASKGLYENIDSNLEKLWTLKNTFIEHVKNEIADIKINGYEREGSAPHIANISFLGIRGEVLLHSLEQDGIYVSTGSACSSRKNTKSHVLNAMGLKEDEIEGAIRFSFSYHNTQEEIDYAVDKIIKSVKDIRKIMKR